MSTTTVYMKHPMLGNEHVPESEVEKRQAEGWTRFPRTPEAKAAGAWPLTSAAPQGKPETVVSLGGASVIPDGAAPVKRKYTRKAA